MLRFLLSTPVLIVLFAAGAMYESYGHVDPCRALAVERARMARHAIGLPVEGVAEHVTRLRTSRMTTGECVSGLLSSWTERLTGR
jgi:hypothetical protein